jgi:hypothetical protein
MQSESSPLLRAQEDAIGDNVSAQEPDAVVYDRFNARTKRVILLQVSFSGFMQSTLYKL